MPETISVTLDEAQAVLGEVQQRSREARRIVFTGNGASLYAAMAGWLESVTGPKDGSPLWMPAGLLRASGPHLGPDDVVIAVSTSGELRDLVELCQDPNPPQVVALTAHPDSTIGRAANVVVQLRVRSQSAVTHTQAYASATAAALVIGAGIADKPTSHVLDAQLSQRVARALEQVRADLVHESRRFRSVVCAGAGRNWPAALQAALMVRELAALPAEGVEAREGVTSSLAVLGPDTLVVVIGHPQDVPANEVEQLAGERGAALIRMPTSDSPAAPLEAFAPSLHLAIELALHLGMDVDQPHWYGDYLRVARQSGSHDAGDFGSS